LQISKVNCKVYDKPKIIDHSWINVEIFTSNEGNKYREFINRDYNKFHIGVLLKALEEGIKYRDDSEVNVRAEIFVQNVVNALDIVAPKKKFKIPKIWEGKKWYSDDIRVTTKRRNEAYIKAMQTCIDEDCLQFVLLERNMVVKLIRKEKKLYYKNMIDCNKNDSVRMWKTLKEVIRGEKAGAKEINNVDFEILQNIEEYDLADKFMLTCIIYKVMI